FRQRVKWQQTRGSPGRGFQESSPVHSSSFRSIVVAPGVGFNWTDCPMETGHPALQVPKCAGLALADSIAYPSFTLDRGMPLVSASGDHIKLKRLIAALIFAGAASMMAAVPKKIAKDIDRKDRSKEVDVIVQFKSEPTDENHAKVKQHNGAFKKDLKLVRG